MDQNLEPLEQLRSQLYKNILANYLSVEIFCHDNGISKTLISLFLNKKRKSLSLKTLTKIANALNMTLEIKLKKQ